MPPPDPTTVQWIKVGGVGKWIDLPASGGADDRFRAGQPLSSGLMQIAANNASLAAYENNLRTLWEHPGQSDIAGLLGYGLRAGLGVSPDDFPWDDDPFASGSVMTLFAGVHRIRQTPDGRWPRVQLHARMSCAGGSTAGLILVGRPQLGRPQPGDLRDHQTVTSTSMADVTCTLAPLNAHIGLRTSAPRDERTVPSPSPAEQGTDTVMAFYVGAYTDGAGKALVRGLSLYLTDP